MDASERSDVFMGNLDCSLLEEDVDMATRIAPIAYALCNVVSGIPAEPPELSSTIRRGDPALPIRAF